MSAWGAVAVALCGLVAAFAGVHQAIPQTVTFAHKTYISDVLFVEDIQVGYGPPEVNAELASRQCGFCRGVQRPDWKALDTLPPWRQRLNSDGYGRNFWELGSERPFANVLAKPRNHRMSWGLAVVLDPDLNVTFARGAALISNMRRIDVDIGAQLLSHRVLGVSEDGVAFFNRVFGGFSASLGSRNGVSGLPNRYDQGDDLTQQKNGLEHPDEDCAASIFCTLFRSDGLAALGAFGVGAPLSCAGWWIGLNRWAGARASGYRIAGVLLVLGTLGWLAALYLTLRLAA